MLGKVGFLVSCLMVASMVDAAEPWPAESAAEAVNLTSVEGPEPNDFHVDLSGAFWNTRARRLWICSDGPGDESKLWSLIPDAAGSFEIEYRAGNRGEWTGFGNIEDVTQSDLDADVVYLIVEGEERIKAYDVSSFGTAAPLRDWNVQPHLPLLGGAGSEGIAFVPDRFLAAGGFVNSEGAPYTSTRGMGGLMLVGHQNGGGVYAFDLDPASDDFTFVGEYRTGYAETAALHFDRGNGRLYVWHDAEWDTWEVCELGSVSIAGSSARRLNTIRTFDGPHHRNNEGLTLTSIDTCTAGSRGAFLATDGGGFDSLTWFTQYAEGCTTLHVDKNTAAGTVELQWSGGWAPYTLLRAADPAMIQGRIALIEQAPMTTASDPVLIDDESYYYLVP